MKNLIQCDVCNKVGKLVHESDGRESWYAYPKGWLTIELKGNPSFLEKELGYANSFDLCDEDSKKIIKILKDSNQPTERTES